MKKIVNYHSGTLGLAMRDNGFSQLVATTGGDIHIGLKKRPLSQRDEWTKEYIDSISFIHNEWGAWYDVMERYNSFIIYYKVEEDVSSDMEIFYRTSNGNKYVVFPFLYLGTMYRGVCKKEDIHILKNMLVFAPNKDIGCTEIGYRERIFEHPDGMQRRKVEIMGFLYIPERLQSVAGEYLWIKK